MYMHYGGRAVEVSGWLVNGRPVPLLYPGDPGDGCGDVAVIDGELVEWDGRCWMTARIAADLDAGAVSR